MWNRSDVDFIQTQDVPWEAIDEGAFGFLGGGRAQRLSRDHTDGAETTLTRVNDRQRGVLSSAVDLFVYRGEGTLNGEELHTGDYVYIPAGTDIDLVPSVRGLTLYCGFWGPPTLAPSAGSVRPLGITRPERLSWVPAGWSGDVQLEPGAMVKLLRESDDAYIYLAAMLPGWRSEHEESHPVYEESFKIYGDVLMGARGVMWEGAYFYRAPDVFHGPLYSRTGTMSFIRSDAGTTTTYREVAPGGSWEELARHAYPF